MGGGDIHDGKYFYLDPKIIIILKKIKHKFSAIGIYFVKFCHVSPCSIAIYSKPFRVALKQSLPLQL